MHAKNPDLYQLVEFRKTTAYGLIFLAYRMFEYGEAHFQSLMVDLKDTWTDAPASNGVPFPFTVSEADIGRIKVDCAGAVAGTELVSEVKERMGELWPDKGFAEHERYHDCKAALQQIKSETIEQLDETEEKAEYEQCWPFE